MNIKEVMAQRQWEWAATLHAKDKAGRPMPIIEKMINDWIREICKAEGIRISSVGVIIPGPGIPHAHLQLFGCRGDKTRTLQDASIEHAERFWRDGGIRHTERLWIGDAKINPAYSRGFGGYIADRNTPPGHRIYIRDKQLLKRTKQTTPAKAA